MKINEAMQPNNENLITRETKNNKTSNSLILEKIAAQRVAEEREIFMRSQPNLSKCLRNDL